ncbi:MAG: 50S ribosomal protein L21 [Cyclobacteriaceae bacterium]|nr:50S ribosomal protein L21 [Cyclobacteriaceae bacterium]
MYAIVDIAGKQIRVSKDQAVLTPRLDKEVGDSVEFDKVLLIEDEGKVSLGTPLVKKAKVSGKVVDHGKGDTIIVFKKKRRKGYKVKNGHRQGYTKVMIDSISK